MNVNFRIIVDENPIQLEVGRNVLDMTIRISSYIHNNFEASDFFTIGHTRQYVVTQFLEVLQEAMSITRVEDDKVLLSLKRDLLGNYDRDQYHMLERVLWYGCNFGDDIPELEPYHDEIFEIYDAYFP